MDFSSNVQAVLVPYCFVQNTVQCMMLMHDDACCMMMRDSMSLQGVTNEQDYDAQHDAAEHPQDAV